MKRFDGAPKGKKISRFNRFTDRLADLLYGPELPTFEQNLRDLSQYMPAQPFMGYPEPASISNELPPRMSEGKTITTLSPTPTNPVRVFDLFHLPEQL